MQSIRNRSPFPILLFVVLLFCAHSCISSGKLIDAQSLGKRNSSIQIQLEPHIFNEAPPSDRSPAGVGLAASYIGGLTNTYDIGVSIEAASVIGISNKLHLVDKVNFDFAVGLDLKTGIASNSSFISPSLYFTYTAKIKGGS